MKALMEIVGTITGFIFVAITALIGIGAFLCIIGLMRKCIEWCYF